MRVVVYDDDRFETFDLYIRVYLAGRKTHVYGGQWIDIAKPADHSFGVYHALLLGSVSCGAAALRQLDALTLLSREDPYPIVALEAGAMAIPTVCFRHSGGIAELADQGYGVPIDYLDLDAFAAALVQLQQQPELRQALGKRFQEKVFKSSTVATQAAEIAALIDGTNNRNPSLNPG
jgi:hypothetical protein